MNSPYRDHPPHVDTRHEAETRLINARAACVEEIKRGLTIANELARQSMESATSYSTRVDSLRALYSKVTGGI